MQLRGTAIRLRKTKKECDNEWGTYIFTIILQTPIKYSIFQVSFSN